MTQLQPWKTTANDKYSLWNLKKCLIAPLTCIRNLYNLFRKKKLRYYCSEALLVNFYVHVLRIVYFAFGSK